MPVKWTPETDQILLLKILETSDISPKCAEISQRWPSNSERPTPRAISERLFKIRAQAKASGASGHYSVPNADSGNTPGTPRKRAASGVKKATPKKNGAGGGAAKRKRGGRMSDDDPSDDSEATTFKPSDNDDDDDEESPKKKAKGRANGKIKIEKDQHGDEQFHDSGYENPFGGDVAAEDFLSYA